MPTPLWVGRQSESETERWQQIDTHVTINLIIFNEAPISMPSHHVDAGNAAGRQRYKSGVIKIKSLKVKFKKWHKVNLYKRTDTVWMCVYAGPFNHIKLGVDIDTNKPQHSPERQSNTSTMTHTLPSFSPRSMTHTHSHRQTHTHKQPCDDIWTETKANNKIKSDWKPEYQPPPTRPPPPWHFIIFSVSFLYYFKQLKASRHGVSCKLWIKCGHSQSFCTPSRLVRDVWDKPTPSEMKGNLHALEQNINNSRQVGVEHWTPDCGVWPRFDLFSPTGVLLYPSKYNKNVTYNKTRPWEK